jgi:hypothetical protein
MVVQKVRSDVGGICNLVLFMGLFATSIRAIPVQLSVAGSIKYPIKVACECDYSIYVDGKYIDNDKTEVKTFDYLETGWNATKRYYPYIHEESPKIIAFNGIGNEYSGFLNGFIMDMNNGADYTKYQEWKCKDFTKTPPSNWFTYDYDDSDWSISTSYGANYQNNSFQIFETERREIHLQAEWLWTQNNRDANIYCRKKNNATSPLPSVVITTTSPPLVTTTIDHPPTTSTHTHTHMETTATHPHVSTTIHHPTTTTTHPHVSTTIHHPSTTATHPHVPTTIHHPTTTATHPHVSTTIHHPTTTATHPHVPTTTTHPHVSTTIHHPPTTVAPPHVSTTIHHPPTTVAPPHVSTTIHHPTTTMAPPRVPTTATHPHVPTTATHSHVSTTIHHPTTTMATPRLPTTTTHPHVPTTIHHPSTTVAPPHVSTTIHHPSTTVAPPHVSTTIRRPSTTATHTHVSTTIHHPSTTATHPHVPTTAAPPHVSTTIHNTISPINIKIVINNIKYSKGISDQQIAHLLENVKFYRDNNNQQNTEYDHNSLYRTVLTARLSIIRHYENLIRHFEHLERIEHKSYDEHTDNADNADNADNYDDHTDSNSSENNTSKSNIIQSMIKLNSHIKSIENSIHLIKGNHKYLLLHILKTLKQQYEKDTMKIFNI